MQVIEVPLMVNPCQDEALATQTMALKRIRQKRDTTTGLLFSNLTSLRMNELTGESAASIVLAYIYIYIYIIFIYYYILYIIKLLYFIFYILLFIIYYILNIYIIIYILYIY